MTLKAQSPSVDGAAEARWPGNPPKAEELETAVGDKARPVQVPSAGAEDGRDSGPGLLICHRKHHPAIHFPSLAGVTQGQNQRNRGPSWCSKAGPRERAAWQTSSHLTDGGLGSPWKSEHGAQQAPGQEGGQQLLRPGEATDPAILFL